MNGSFMEVDIENNWQVTENGLYRKIVFKDFVQAFGFMTQVAILAEKSDHHPTWKNTYHTVEIWLQTHDQHNQITEKDIDLAKAINELLNE
ncbi:MAG: 4a-hydroxytetrahydrobiopterin dehydratase [Chitinophagales bacterium]|nr:4a-hydroxytetrahydrobiopterin dehydratase [Chitinophagales bacterium]